MSDLIKTLKSKNDNTINIYPNIKPENIPDSAIANSKIQDNSISTSKIQDSAITTNKINDNAISTAKIQDASISTAKIQDASISTNKIQDGSINFSKIANNSVGTAKLVDNSITTNKLQFHLYHYNGDFKFTFNLVDYLVYVDIISIYYIADALLSDSDAFRDMWNYTYNSDTTPRRFLALDKTNNKNVYVDLYYDDVDQEFKAYIIDGTITNTSLTTNDYTIDDLYRTTLF